jgi:SNF family Na+-dependent transporter
MTKNRIYKYLGTIGLVGPFVILIYYMYVESWTLGYAFFSITGTLFKNPDQASMKAFLSGYQGLAQNEFFSGIGTAYIFFIITFFVNFFFIYRGLQGGIEKLSKYGMPVLVIIGILLAIRTLTLGTPDASFPERTIKNALGFVWNPDFSKLFDAKVWLEAAGQIFFTLSVGIGCILTYASYLKKKDDIALSGLSAASANEFCEVILGGSIVIPAAFVFFGGPGAIEVAKSGTFNIGFVSMPLIFSKIPLGFVFSCLWFILLFIAGITSSVSLIEPGIAFLRDEFKINRRIATIILGILAFLLCQPGIFFLGKGVVDELDFWGGTMFLVIFSTIEIILFGWIMGIDKGWEELHAGTKIKIPKVYKYIIKYVTPLYLLILLVVWSYQQFVPAILLKGVSANIIPYIWGTRTLVFGLLLVAGIMVFISWRKKDRK